MSDFSPEQYQCLYWYLQMGVHTYYKNPTQTPNPLPTGVDSLEKLYKDISESKGCALKETALHTVFADGDHHSSLMLIGEAPGSEEDRLGKPFMGISGQLLNMMLQAIGWKREEVYITNIVPWRPPLNRPPTPQEIQFCLPFVERHIALIRPRLLIFVGGTAAKALMRSSEGITGLQKKELLYPMNDSESIPAIAMYHPSYLLRSPGQKKIAWQQLLRIQSLLQQT